MKDLSVLKERIKGLTVFRELLNEKPINKLLVYLENPSIESYADFVYVLYEANGGNVSKYVRELCENSQNVYVKSVAKTKTAPKHIYEAMEYDVKTLQEIANLTPNDLMTPIRHGNFLPAFEFEKVQLLDEYIYRTQNVEKYGYGIYAKNRMFYVDGDKITAVKNPDKIRLTDLIDYESERQIIIDNTKALLDGKPAANVLLTGDAGTGKSSTVKGIVNEFWEDGLRIIQIKKEQLSIIPKILDELSNNPLKFILFIDDLSFLKDDDNFNSLKAVLEGSVTAKSQNVVIYATSNRTHIIKEKFSEREGDDIHHNDTVQELMSLSERFGIRVTFSKPDKKTYLNIVNHLVKLNNISVDKNDLEILAERFALEHGGRSARIARQFVDFLVTKEGK